MCLRGLSDGKFITHNRPLESCKRPSHCTCFPLFECCYSLKRFPRVLAIFSLALCQHWKLVSGWSQKYLYWADMKNVNIQTRNERMFIVIKYLRPGHDEARQWPTVGTIFHYYGVETIAPSWGSSLSDIMKQPSWLESSYRLRTTLDQIHEWEKNSNGRRATRKEIRAHSLLPEETRNKIKCFFKRFSRGWLDSLVYTFLHHRGRFSCVVQRAMKLHWTQKEKKRGCYRSSQTLAGFFQLFCLHFSSRGIHSRLL